jgi:hypothetical protein
MEVTGMAIVMAIMVILPVTVTLITVMDIPIEIITLVMAGIIKDQRTATIVGGEIKGEESGVISACFTAEDMLIFGRLLKVRMRNPE